MTEISENRVSKAPKTCWHTVRPLAIAAGVICLLLAALGLTQFAAKVLVITVYVFGVLCCVITMGAIPRFCGLGKQLPVLSTRRVLLPMLSILLVEVLSIGLTSTFQRWSQSAWLFGDFSNRPAAYIGCEYDGKLSVMYVPRATDGPQAATGWGVFLTRSAGGNPVQFWSSSSQSPAEPDGIVLFDWMTGPTIQQNRVTGRYCAAGMHFLVASVLLLLYPGFVLPKVIRQYRRNRRRGRGQCSSCGYDLTGNLSGICPECGRNIKSEPASTGSTPHTEHRATHSRRSTRL